MKLKLRRILTALVLVALAVALCVIPSSADSTEQTLIDGSTVWRYLDDNTDPSADCDSLNAWTLADYDDAAWKTGSGTFGSKNGALNAVQGWTPTVLLEGCSGSNDHYAYFFRTTVNIDDASAVMTLSFLVKADDTVTVYINGNIVIDTRKSSSTTTNLYYSTADTYTVTCWFGADELSGVLVDGDNVIAAEIHNDGADSSDIYFECSASAVVGVNDGVTEITDVILGVGADQSQRTFNWCTDSSARGYVQIALADDVVNDTFPKSYTTFASDSEKANNSLGEYSHKATATSLKENTDYVYRIKVGDTYSQLYYFTVGSFDSFGFIAFGDPQIRNYALTSDGDKWEATVREALKGLESDFFITMGDQVNTNTDEAAYTEFFIDALRENATAVTVGNHDTGSSAFSDHFNLPNLSDSYGVSSTSADYYFKYNNTLFMVLNWWNSDSAEHLAFIEESIDANPDCIWKVVVMHIAPFSAGNHSVNDANVASIKSEMLPAFNTLGIDLVLGGHDHIYTRSYLMSGAEVMSDQTALDTAGVLYICAGSSAGKFYETSYVDTTASYVAKTYYEQNRTFVHFSVIDTKITLTTYLVDDMSVIDTYTLEKSETAHLKETIARAEQLLVEAEGKLPESEYSTLKQMIEEYTALLDSYTDADALDAAALALIGQTSAVKIAISEYDTWSVGAEKTALDSTATVTVLHLNSDGVYTIEGTQGSGKALSIVQTVDGVAEAVLTWTEGNSSASKNPFIVLILDEDATLSGAFAWQYTNVVIDLNSHNLTFSGTASTVVTMSNYGTLEIRGEGDVIWDTSSNNYFVQGNHYNTSIILNGKIRVSDNTGKGKYVFYSKGTVYVYGALTIDGYAPSTDCYAFYIQGSRSSGDDRSGSVNIVNATLNYNCTSGAPLFYAKGVSGTGATDGLIYTSIPSVNIVNSNLYTTSPLITASWASASASGYADTGKVQALTNCVNKCALNIIGSYVYAELYYDSSTTSSSAVTLIDPAGYTDITVSDSYIYTQHGTIFKASTSGELNIKADNSTFIAETDEDEAKASDISSSYYSILRGVVLSPCKNTVGTAVFNGCNVSAAYRVFDGGFDSPDNSTFFITCTDSCISICGENAAARIVARANLVLDACTVDCYVGSFSTSIFRYNADMGVGVLVKRGTVIKNITVTCATTDGDHGSVSYYAQLAQTDSTVYTATVSTSKFTVEDGVKFVPLTDITLLGSAKYAYVLVDEAVNVGTVTSVKTNLKLADDIVINFYVPAYSEISSVDVGFDGDAEVSYSLQQLTSVTTDLGGADYYLVSFSVSVLKLDCDVTLTVNYGLYDSSSFTLSVFDYCNTVLTGSFSMLEKQLVADTLAYARAAAAYVDADEYDTLIAGIDAQLYKNGVTPTAAEHSGIASDMSGVSEVFEGVHMTLGSEVSFVFERCGSLEGVRIGYWSNGSYTEAEASSLLDGDGNVVVTMRAYDMAQDITVITENSRAVFNLDAYIALSDSTDTALYTLLCALHNYADSASALHNAE